jgi:hypothetical protein
MTLLIFGAMGLWLRAHVPTSSTRFELFILAAGFLLFLWKSRAILDFLKSRVTYPRTGYVRPPEESARPDVLITLSLKPSPPPDENVTRFQLRTVTVILCWWFFLDGMNPWKRWCVPLAMPALAVTLYALNRNSERPFRWWSALILALTGPALLWLDVPTLLQPPLPVLLAGGWLVTNGACTLVHYLRANPHPRAPEGVRA